MTLNPNPKLTSGVASDLFQYAVFAPHANSLPGESSIRPWPIRSLELSLCGTFVPMLFILSLFTARLHCLQYRHTVLAALGELLVWHRQGLVQSIV